MLTLEDVAAHVHAPGAVGDGPVGHGQGLVLRQLLAAGDDDGHGTGGHYLLKVIAVVGLDEGRPQLCQHPGGQQEILGGAGHLLAHGGDAQNRDAVPFPGVHGAA